MAASIYANLEFQGKVVAITGAASEVGKALCWHFGRRGARIAALDKSEQLTPFVDQLRSEVIIVGPSVVDAADSAVAARAFRHMVARLGPIDILIDLVVSGANLDATRNCTHAVLPDMQARRTGTIVNVASAPDAGLVSFTESVAAEYGPFNVRANVLSLHSLARPVDPAEVVRVVAFLVSDTASTATGAVLPAIEHAVEGGANQGPDRAEQGGHRIEAGRRVYRSA